MRGILLSNLHQLLLTVSAYDLIYISEIYSYSKQYSLYDLQGNSSFGFKALRFCPTRH